MDYRCIHIALLISLSVTGCSNKQVYEAIQQNRQLECQKEPQSQYDECMKRVSEPYGSYQRKREQHDNED